MVLLSPAIPPVAYWEFEADLLILHHPTTISTKYQAMGMSILSLIEICFSTIKNKKQKLF